MWSLSNAETCVQSCPTIPTVANSEFCLQELLRAEIEAIKSGNESSDRYALSISHVLTCRADVSRLKELQDKVTELESETDRLSHALEAQKVVTLEAQVKAVKQAEEISKELQKKVISQMCPVPKSDTDRRCERPRPRKLTSFGRS